MLPITPAGFRRYVRFNAMRKGLLGGSKLWLGVYAAGRLRAFSGRVTKKGEAPVMYSGPVDGGHWTEIVHERPRPDASALKAGRKASKRADRTRRRVEAAPTRRNIRRAVRAQVRASSANQSLGPQRVPVEPLRLGRTQLTAWQRRALKKAGVKPLGPLEKLDRRAIRDFP